MSPKNRKSGLNATGLEMISSGNSFATIVRVERDEAPATWVEQDDGPDTIYDTADAVAFICDKTGESDDIVRRVLQSRELLENAYRAQEARDKGVSAQVVNAEGMVWQEASTIQPASEAVLQYLKFATGISESRAARILAEEVGYYVSIGSMDAGTYPYFLEWAESVRQS